MIISIIVGMLVFWLVILFITLRQSFKSANEWKEKYWDENRLHLDTKLELERELNSYKLKLKQSNDELNKYMRSIKERAQERDEYKKQLDELMPKTNSEKNQEDQPEQGTFVKQRKLSAATPGTYRNVFDLDINGQRVLDHLELTFANKSTYVRGGQDAERESCYRAGQASVIGFIFNQVNRANNPDYKESDND